MAGKFEIFKDNAGEYRFRLRAGNGEIIANSEGYTSKNACEKGIASVKENARDAIIEDTTKNNPYGYI